MKNSFHHGEKLRLLFAEFGKKAIDIAEIRGVKKQSISNDFNREKIGLNTLKEYCDILNIRVEDFLTGNVNLSTQKSTEETFQEKYYKLLETTNYLWKVVAKNNIKVELPLNFNQGVLIPTYDHFFLNPIGHKLTHP